MEIQYARNDLDFHRGTFRARGDVIEIFPASSEAKSVRIELFGDIVDAIHEIDPLTGKSLGEFSRRSPSIRTRTISSRRIAMSERSRESKKNWMRGVAYFKQNGQLLEAQRIEQRTKFDLEMIRAMGYCHGIENYSRHLSGRAAKESRRPR